MIKSFLSCLEAKIEEIKNSKHTTIFTISSTSDHRMEPYLTPSRKSNGYCVFGCVLYDEVLVPEVIDIIDGKVNWIAVDAEKKLNIEKVFNQKNTLECERNNESISTGNLSRIVTKKPNRSKVFEYKANDITVDAIWNLCSDYFKCLSGIRTGIIGAGNIGSKLALKLVESGVDVSIYRRNIYKAHEITNALNLIKPETTMSSVKVANSPISCAFSSDIVIGTNSGGPLITESVLAAASKGAIFIDVGKGSLDSSAINYAQRKGITIHRLDVGYQLLTTLVANVNYLENFHKHRGEKQWNGKRIVAGGFYGFNGDVVIDSILSPKSVFGYADGYGNIRNALSKEEEIFLEKMKSAIDDKKIW